MMVQMSAKNDVRYDPKSTILVFLDEYGNSSLKDNDRPLARYLSVTSFSVEQEYYENFVKPQYLDLKERILGPGPTTLHYSDIFHRTGAFKGWDEKRIQSCWRQIMEFVGTLRATLRCICIDKKAQTSRNPFWDEYSEKDPYELAIALHFERIVFQLSKLNELKQRKYVARLCAESRNPKLNRRVEAIFKTIWKNGHDLFDKHGTITPRAIQSSIPSSALPFFDKHCRIVGLELCDLVTNPLTWVTLNSYSIDIRPMRIRDQIFLEKCKPLIEQSLSGKIRGYGIKLYPRS